MYEVLAYVHVWGLMLYEGKYFRDEQETHGGFTTFLLPFGR